MVDITNITIYTINGSRQSFNPLAELSQRILDSSNGLVVFVVNVL